MRKLAAIVCAAFLLGAPAARALVILGGNGAANFTNPGGGLPWANVGSIHGASGVYLGSYGGNYWVLTASHVVSSGDNLGNLVLASGTFGFVPGSGIVVRNGDSSATDLTLFRISTDPGLSNLALASDTPDTGSLLTYVAKGKIEGSANYWSVAVNGGANNDVWTDLGANSSGANAAGYLWANAAGERWGQNELAGFSTFNVGTGTTAAFYTEFQNTAGSTQGATGDSGGAAFVHDGDSWELIGILGAVAGYENQPASTAVLGNLTFASDIASYRGFILAAIPEPSVVGGIAGILALGVAAWARGRPVTS